MSFITKRERVFNEHAIFDLPARNEGKLKAYASCTDARAWSHFCSDKTEHLVDIIKRNNETCRKKYVPTTVIVETLMVAKNAEISRLKNKIQEFEQLLAAYDQLDLTYEQKSEIANAHASIKAANKELDDLCLDLDLSGYTEGIDSDAFETGKSRGDEPSRHRCDEIMTSKGSEWSFDKDLTTPKMEHKSNQVELANQCDVSTSVHDPRIQEMQDSIISKDAKLNAMQNTIAVMENDVCEPYCIYAHIYTALEKIFGVLCQNEKYRLYLSLMTASKNTKCIDIKGKIMFKLKVLEKFSLALIAPCSQEMRESSQDCACLRAEVVERLDFPPFLAEPRTSAEDNIRAQLVADIMENDEMKELLTKNSFSENRDDDQIENSIGYDTYSIRSENLKRLKNLQENYDDLMTCYEKIKYEKDVLQKRCLEYEALEKEFDNLKDQLREYNALWTEKEHYRKRSMDIDSLKEQYFILADESSNIENKLKAESEISHIKSNTIEELTNENIVLEKKINEAVISFEKEKNTLQCKLKETECTVICQDQQIKSLALQIDRLLEQSRNKMDGSKTPSHSLICIDEVESLKEEIKVLKEALSNGEEENQYLQNEFQDKLNIIHKLRTHIEDLKSTHDKILERNDYLEKYADKVDRLVEENRHLSQELEEKEEATRNLIEVLHNKSEEIKNLTEIIEQKDDDQKTLNDQVQKLRQIYHLDISAVEDEKLKALDSLELAKQESQELLAKVKNYNDIVIKNDSIQKSLELKSNDYDDLKQILHDTVAQNKILEVDLVNTKNNNSILIQECQTLKNNILHLENLIRKTKETSDNLRDEKEKLEIERKHSKQELEDTLQSLHLCKKESVEFIDNVQILEEKVKQLITANNELIDEKRLLQLELTDKNKDLESILISLNDRNELLLKTSEKTLILENELSNLKSIYDDLLSEKAILQNKLEEITNDFSNMSKNMEITISENSKLQNKIKGLELNQKTSDSNIFELKNENLIAQNTLNDTQKDCAALMNKLKDYETLEIEYEKLKSEHEFIHDKLLHQNNLSEEIQKQNQELNNQNHNLQTLNESLEKSLINLRSQHIMQSGSTTTSYEDILTEIEEMKKEKLRNHQEVKDLLNKLEESGTIILNLRQDIISRDDKIATLDNYINHLEEEIRKLHENLDQVINTGESISNNSFLTMDQSLKTIEAHHSKATHNMKLELAKLQNENSTLEQQLSVTKMNTEESTRDKNKYLSQVLQLQNERDVIVSNIIKLELTSLGNSDLSSTQCKIKDILASLDRISKSMESKTSKSSSLEQTILKVQSSSQLLLAKANEAKMLVEKEKHKIITEKEDAIRERLNMEKKVDEINKMLENQINNDTIIIKDLEANILNQKLLSEHTIFKLKEELSTLKSLNENTSSTINALQDKICQLTEDNEKYRNINVKLNTDLNNASKEKETLQVKLENIYNKPVNNIEVQAYLPYNHKNTQTEKTLFDDFENTSSPAEQYISKPIQDKQTVKRDMEVMPYNIEKRKPPESVQIMSNSPPENHNFYPINKVQILTANMDPTFDVVRSSYLNYKMQRLSPGRLEQYSISNINMPGSSSQVQNTSLVDTTTSDPHLINIFNRSVHSISSKLIENTMENIFSEEDPQTVTQSSAFTKLAFTNDSVDTESNNIEKHKYTSLQKSISQELTDADNFIVYNNSENNTKDLLYGGEKKMTTIDQTAILADTVKDKQLLRKKIKNKRDKQRKPKNNSLLENNLHLKEENDDNNLKPKLKITLPRVENDSSSMTAALEVDRRSQDSNTHINRNHSLKQTSFTDLKHKRNSDLSNVKQQTPSLPTIVNVENQNFESNNSIKLQSEESISSVHGKNKESPVQVTTQQSDKKIKIIRSQITLHSDNENEQNYMDSYSNHSLSRVEGDISLISSKHSVMDTIHHNVPSNQSTNVALKYISDSVQRDVNMDNAIYVGHNLRKSKSDERFDVEKSSIGSIPPKDSLTKVASLQYEFCTLPILPKDSPTKVASSQYESCSLPNQKNSNTSTKSSSKNLDERSVMAKLKKIDTNESKIKFLITALENTEKVMKKRLEAIKTQYDMNIKNILIEHNLGVKNIQGLHEETLQDVIKIHDNEIENLRTMSIEANRKAERLEKENCLLKAKIPDLLSVDFDEERISITPDIRKRRKPRADTKMLTKTYVDTFNVKPGLRSHGPCTCSLDTNVSDTIRNLFKQIDGDQRKTAEHTYVRHIANKLINGNVEALDTQELSFLHLTVCRTWKKKLTKEEALQKRIDTLESELIHKQRNAKQHIAELDRKVAVERRRLQEVTEKVCRGSPTMLQHDSCQDEVTRLPQAAPLSNAPERDYACNCDTGICDMDLKHRRSAGELVPGVPSGGFRQKRSRVESNKFSARVVEERREKKLYDEPPTRLRRTHDRATLRKK